MQLYGQSLRWRGTISLRVDGAPTIRPDDWSLSTEEGETFARVFRTRDSENYFAAVVLGKLSVVNDLQPGRLPTRDQAMIACERRLAAMAEALR